jgi:hypothetical protein
MKSKKVDLIGIKSRIVVPIGYRAMGEKEGRRRND